MLDTDEALLKAAEVVGVLIHQYSGATKLALANLNPFAESLPTGRFRGKSTRLGRSPILVLYAKATVTR